MPQGPIAVSNVPYPKPKSVLNITTATVIKATPGTIVSLNVVVAGSGVGTVNDCATTGAAAASNVVAEIPAAVGAVLAASNFPCATGIVVTPGAGQTIAISYQ